MSRRKKKARRRIERKRAMNRNHKVEVAATDRTCWRQKISNCVIVYGD